MTEITAEMIERGRGADPRIAAERRRLARKVREAREKLTSSGSGSRSFDVELLALYAERRTAASVGLGLLGLVFAAAATQWVPLGLLGGWVGVYAVGLLIGHALARRLLLRLGADLDVRRWTRLLVAAETAQGCIWALLLGLVAAMAEPQAMLFAVIALLLVGAMNATITASLPLAVFAGLTPMTIGFLAILHPQSLVGDHALLAGLAVGIQAYFAYLARKLYLASLQALSFQAEKDELIHELEQSKANSDLARRRAEESNLAKSRFLATMSHELRTPLNAILGFSEVMKSELFGQHSVPAYRDYAHDIHASGEHLLMLINEILDLSRVEAGRYDMREEPVDLAAVVEDCRHLVALRAKKKDIVILQAPGEALPRIWADARALRQVTLNLLSNAIKFTPQGGQVRIEIGASDRGGQFIAITDTGVGIPESELPIIMSTFGRGDFAQKNAEEGTGLGLPIVKGLVELHGGTFELTSKVREGTRARVVLPPERVMNVLPRLDLAGETAAGALEAIRTAA